MIPCTKGKEMFNVISPIYENSSIMQAVFHSIGCEFDNLDNIQEELIAQLFPQTATWGLKFWEQRYDIIINEEEDLDYRRGRVLAKMQARQIVNPFQFASLLKSATGAEAEIVENVAPYTIKFRIDAKNVKYQDDIEKTIKRVKPSHIAYVIEYLYRIWQYFVDNPTTWQTSKEQYTWGTIRMKGE